VLSQLVNFRRLQSQWCNGTKPFRAILFVAAEGSATGLGGRTMAENNNRLFEQRKIAV
jgi:hypothetical protein